MKRLELLFFGVIATFALHASAKPYHLAHTFVDPDGGPGDLFGTAVAIEGGVVAIKSRSGYTDGDGLSRTHVFESNAGGGWDQAATFDFDSGDNDGNFFLGEELAIDNGVVAVSYGPHSLAGTADEPVQVLSREGDAWVRRFAVIARALPRPDPVPRPFPFAGRGQRPAGRTVGIAGDFIIAEEGGLQTPDGSNGGGVARVFQRQDDDSWAETANLFSTTVQEGAQIISADIDGTTAAIAYRNLSERESTLHFFDRLPTGEWVATESFADTPGDVSSLLSLDGDTAVVRPFLTGQLQVYDRIDGVWQRSSLAPPPALPGTPADWLAIDRTSLSGFAIEGDLLAQTIDAFRDEPARIDVYRRDEANEWGLLTTIADPNPEAGLDFGWKLEFDQGRLLVGASSTIEPLDGFESEPAGAAYLFVPVPEPGGFVLLCIGLVAGAGRRPISSIATQRPIS